MSLSLSIVIPTLNEAAAHIAAQLRSLEPLRAAGAELIVADGGSADTTVNAAAKAAEIVHSAPGRSRQMNAGAAIATGDWLLFLHADTRLPGDAASIMAVVARCTSAQWGFFPVKLSGRSGLLRVVERMMSWRSRRSCLATGDQAIFVRRSLFEQLEGYADVPLMEDIELSRRLRRYSRPLIPGRPVVTSSRRWEDKGIIRTILTMWALRAAYACGVSPNRLVKLYYPEMAAEATPKQVSPNSRS